MRIIEPQCEIIPQSPGLEGIYDIIEKAGRNCYQSEPVEGISSEAFVNKLINRGHTSVLEHGTLYLDVPMGSPMDDKMYMVKSSIIQIFKHNPYSKVNKYKVTTEDIDGINISRERYAITSNWRVFIEQIPWEELGPICTTEMEGYILGLDKDYVLSFMCEPTEYHEKRITVKIITDRGVSAELNRHRTHSITEQSTRYCNYSKDKFGNEIPIMINKDVKGNTTLLGVPYIGVKKDLTADYVWEFANAVCEWAYLTLIDKFSWSPQQARRILPLDLATTVFHTAFESDWEHFMNLRWLGKTGRPHPDMLLISKQLKKLLEQTHNETGK